MSKCFADAGYTCTALKVKKCEGCSFFKTEEQLKISREKTENYIRRVEK